MSDERVAKLESPEMEAWFKTIKAFDPTFPAQAVFVAIQMDASKSPGDFIQCMVRPFLFSSTVGHFDVFLVRQPTPS
jgi:hypothetical protein